MKLPIAIGGMLAAAVLAQPCIGSPTYDHDITPILRTYCSGCHNDADAEGELSVETFAALRRGGAESGDPIVPGDPAASTIIRRITSTAADHMPPADEPQPPPAALAILEAWIAAGAVPPAVDTSLLASLTVPRLPPHAGVKPVTALAVAPDGRRLAVARGREVTIVTLAAAGPVADLPPIEVPDPPGTVTALHFSADGRRLVLAGGQAGLAGRAEIRGLATGAVEGTFGEPGNADGAAGRHRDLLCDAELSPDGTILATAGYDRSLKLWDVASGRLLRSIDVHNGAILDVAWHPSGGLLATASADETVKLWRTHDGLRLDTLNQPQGEVSGVAFTPDGGRVIAAGRDKRIHVWKLVSVDRPATNPLLEARFAHEGPIVAMALSADGRALVTSAEDRSLTIWSGGDLAVIESFAGQPDVAAAVAAVPAGGFVAGRMDGSIATFRPGKVTADTAEDSSPTAEVAGAAGSGPVPAGEPATIDEQEPNDDPAAAAGVPLPVVVRGGIGRSGDGDCFRFTAVAGQTLLLEVNAARSGSRLDSRIEVLHPDGRPVERVRLQAVRDSWLTFRGKDSHESGDFRLHNWMEMELNQYVYAGGEVVRLWRYPTGADSGFWVYPGEGNRHTFFGTTAITHALGEPAWVVEPRPPGGAAAANGLPVFPIHFENDDDPQRRLGADSQLLFDPPASGDYVARITDVRGFGGGADGSAAYHYELTIRPSRPSFTVTMSGTDPRVSPGSGREVVFTVERLEGFTGAVTIDAAHLPVGFTLHGPIEVEAGQRKAIAVLSAAADAVAPDEAACQAVAVTARALLPVGSTGAAADHETREVIQPLGTLGTIGLADPPKVILSIEPAVLTIRPGETITAKVRAVRREFPDRIEMGGFDSGRNLPHGVFVDNIGLNGLLIIEGQDEREFFITASPVAAPGSRLFHLRATTDGGQASLPATITVLPR